jgi:NADH-quinone oxidoreductase subunit N
MLIYMAIYVTMNIGTFAFILTMERDGRPVTEISALSRGFASRGRAKALALAGADVLARRCAAARGLLRQVRGASGGGRGGAGAWLAVAGVIASVIGAFYYLRIVYLMYFGEPREGLDGSMPILPYAG